MVYVAAALILLAVVTILNLLFTLGVIRRLREHTELIAQASGHGESKPEGVLAAGETVAAFSVTAVDGRRIDQDSFDDDAMVGFFSPNCGPCKERMPEFVALASALPADSRQVFAVVIGDDDDTAEMVTQLSSAATVISGAAAEPMAEAFGTSAYPALYRMAPGGVVAASGHSMVVYPVLASA